MRFLLLLLFSTLTFADEYLLGQYLGAFETFEAKFSQVTTDTNNKVKQKTSGIVQIKKPKLFHWVTNAPFNQELTSNGETVWFYDEDLEQVTVQPFNEKLANAPLTLLSGDAAAIIQNYNVELQTNDNIDDFILTSKNTNSNFANIRLMFNTGHLQDLQLTDNTGQKTKIVFFEVEMDKELGDDLFTFNIPAGVDVIEK
jgi:outer membrane lipoprotein carrier protein